MGMQGSMKPTDDRAGRKRNDMTARICGPQRQSQPYNEWSIASFCRLSHQGGRGLLGCVDWRSNPPPPRASIRMARPDDPPSGRVLPLSVAPGWVGKTRAEPGVFVTPHGATRLACDTRRGRTALAPTSKWLWILPIY